ncbi:hypothetical protein [Paenibacillus daejeonensis]|uniref:hypothetical protein n=1 Tax=Paenibacillus daejeonensis TaxID=135193 RepID=UPI0012F9369D|nr:hypothetical protein [Paenibacillus daejeonensis]
MMAAVFLEIDDCGIKRHASITWPPACGSWVEDGGSGGSGGGAGDVRRAMLKTKMQLKPAFVMKIRLVTTKIQLVAWKYPNITENERINCTFDFKIIMSLVYEFLIVFLSLRAFMRGRTS